MMGRRSADRQTRHPQLHVAPLVGELQVLTDASINGLILTLQKSVKEMYSQMLRLVLAFFGEPTVPLWAICNPSR